VTKLGITIGRFAMTGAFVVSVVAALVIGSRIAEDFSPELAASSVPAPKVTREPNVPADDRVAKFRLAHSNKKAAFECALQRDGGAISYSPCGANPRYQGLGQSDYCFLARAIVSGARSDPATFCWTNYSPATFGISGSMTQQLYPGNPGEPLDLVFENPNNQDIKVLEVAVSVADATNRGGQLNPGCVGSTHLSVVKQLTAQVVVPRNSTRSLSDLGVGIADYPVVKFLNLPMNQDACKSTRFTFTYAGTASK
jgi:hypothetical protein